MPRNRAGWRRTMWLAAGLCIGATGGVHGQHASVGYQLQSWSSDELQRFSGGLLRIDWAGGAELFFDMGTARWGGEGTTCAGFIPDPSVCVFEPMNVSSVTMGMGAGLRVAMLGVPGGELLVVPFAGWAFAHLGRTGKNTGGSIDDSLAMIEAGMSVRYRTHPLLWNLVGLFAEVRVSAGTDLPGSCVDCYDPLRGSASRRSFLAGVSVGR